MFSVGGVLPFPRPCCCLGARDSEAPPAPPPGIRRPDERVTCGFGFAGGLTRGEPDEDRVQPSAFVAAADLERLPSGPERPDPARSEAAELRRLGTSARRPVAVRPGRADALVRPRLHQAGRECEPPGHARGYPG